MEDADSASADSIDASIKADNGERNTSVHRRVLRKMQSDVTDVKMSLFYARQVDSWSILPIGARVWLYGIYSFFNVCGAQLNF